MAGLSSIYADLICGTSHDKLSPEVRLQAKWRILDLIGACLAGYKLMEELPQWVVNYLVDFGGLPEATIIAQKGKKFPAINAALANGVGVMRA